MDAAKSAGDVDELLARMQSVRACGNYHAEELHVEAKRLVDWKEYVRSQPLISIAVASLVGFSIVRSTLGTNSQSNHPLPCSTTDLEDFKPGQPRQSSQSSWKSGAIALVSSVATTAAKYYLVALLQPRRTEGGFNDRFRNTDSKEQSIGAAQ